MKQGHSAPLTQIKLSKDETKLFTGSYDRKIMIWDLLQTDRKPVVLDKHDANIVYLLFNSDETEMFSSSADCVILKWNLLDL